jgi:hypothetical protein
MTLETIAVIYLAIASIGGLIYTIWILVQQSREEEHRPKLDIMTPDSIDFSHDDSIDEELSNHLYGNISEEKEVQMTNKLIDNTINF